MSRDDKHWQSNKPAYQSTHFWVRKNWGKATKCEGDSCSGKSKTYEWANLEGKYTRSRADWKQMCHSCHFKYDFSIGQREKCREASRIKGVNNNYAPRKAVSQYTLDGILVESYVSLAEAARQVGLSVSQVWRCASEKAEGKTGGGFIWRYTR